MSELQLSLLVIGVLVVGAVYLYNWWQERRLRQRLQEAFGEERDDALMTASGESSQAPARVEPQLHGMAHETPQETEPEPEPLPATPPPAPAAAAATASATPAPDVPWFDEVLDYVAEIRAPRALSAAALAELFSRAAAAGKPWRAAGYNEETGEWEDIARTGGGRHSRVRLALQLVTRNGAVTAPQLRAFNEAVRACASKAGGTGHCPDPEDGLEQARALDGFCANMDVAIGINVVAASGKSFSGRAIRTNAEAAGFKLEPDGVFHYRDGTRNTLFTLDNHEPLPFIPEQINTLSTSGVTLLLDVPRVADGKHALDLMVEAAQRLATALGGRLVDDNRAPLSPAGIAAIRQQLHDIASAMSAQGVTPGSERALRLFS